MRITSKTIVWSWIGLGLIFSLIIFSAFSRLKPDSLVELLEHKISDIIPNSTLKVGNVKYGVALDFKLTLENIDLYKNNKSFVQARLVEMKIPWWLILLNKGDIHLTVEDVQVLISENEVKDFGLGTEKQTLPKVALIEINVPGYLLNAKYTFKGKNLQIKSAEEDRNYLLISKLNVRDFKFDKNSAFEVNIPVSINMNDQKFNSELWLFGDVTPSDSVWNLNYRGEFKSIEVGESFKFDDIVLDGAAAFTPAKYQMNSSLDIAIEKVKVGEGSFITDSRKSDLSFTFSKLPLSYLSVFGPQIGLNQSLSGIGTGSLKVRRNLTSGTPFDVLFTLDHQEDFKISKDLIKKGTWNLEIDNTNTTVSFTSNDGNFKINKSTSQNSEVQKIVINNEEFKSFINFLPGLASVVLNNEKDVGTEVTFTNLSDKEISYTGNMKLSRNSSEQTYVFDLSGKKKSLNLKFQRHAGVFKLESKFKQAPGFLVSHLMNPYILNSESVFDGYFRGEWSESWESGKWDINYTVQSGIEKFGQIDNWEAHLLNFFSIDSDFDHSRYDIKVHDGKIDFKNQHWNLDEKIELKGVLSDNPQVGSYVILDYPLNKSWKEVRKEVNSTFWRADKND